MNPRVVTVSPHSELKLLVTFANGETRLFDASAYVKYPVFERLRDPGYFALARAQDGTVQWPDGSDFCPDTLYLESYPVRA